LGGAHNRRTRTRTPSAPRGVQHAWVRAAPLPCAFAPARPPASSSQPEARPRSLRGGGGGSSSACGRAWTTQRQRRPPRRAASLCGGCNAPPHHHAPEAAGPPPARPPPPHRTTTPLRPRGRRPRARRPPPLAALTMATRGSRGGLGLDRQVARAARGVGVRRARVLALVVVWGAAALDAARHAALVLPQGPDAEHVAHCGRGRETVSGRGTRPPTAMRGRQRRRRRRRGQGRPNALAPCLGPQRQAQNGLAPHRRAKNSLSCTIVSYLPWG
jgi:hypothetical protein